MSIHLFRVFSILAFLTLIGLGQARAQIVIGAGDGSAAPGALVSLPLDATGGLAATQWELSFDPDVLGFESVNLVTGSALHGVDSRLVAPGRLRIVLYPTACPIGTLPAPGLTGQLRLRIAANAPAGEQTLRIEHALAVDAAGTALPVTTLRDGRVTILGGAAPVAPVFIPGPNGLVLALLATVLLIIAIVVLRRRAGIAFLVAFLVIGSAPPTVQAQAGAGSPSPSAIVDLILERGGDASTADCNGDGRIDVADVVCAQQALCGQPGNQPPTLVAIPDAMIQAGDAWSHQASASDPDGDPLTWTLPQAPVGLTLSATGLLSWTPDATQLGIHDVQVQVADPDGLSASVAFRLSVAEVFVNHPPSLAAIADRLLRVGQVLGIQAQASDPDPDDVLHFSLDGAPAGLSLDMAAGRILWSPTAGQTGVHPLTLRVTDRGGLSDSASFFVTVEKLGAPPQLAPIADQVLVLGQSLDISAQASDPDLPDDQLTFSLTAAPAGMQINATSGRLLWTPAADQTGDHDVTVQVSDRVGLIDFTRFLATVQGDNRAPVARDDVYSVRFGEVLEVAATGVLGNDEDADGDALVANVLEGPRQGVLTLDPEGSFTYRPGTTGAGVAQGIDLTALLLPEVRASSTYSTAYPAARLVDGDLNTSWFSARPHGEEWVDIVFSSNVVVRSIELYGNREYATIGYAVTAGVLELYDADDALLFASEELQLTTPEPARDLVFDVEAAAGGAVEQVRRVRFRITGYGSTGDVGLAEIRVIGDGVVQALDPVEKWAWPAETATGNRAVSMTPVVIDLNADGVPEVLFVTQGRELVAVDGRDGSERFRHPGMRHIASSIAAGDIDGDGVPEILLDAQGNYITALDHDGAQKWTLNLGFSIGVIALADIDGDGVTEIIGGQNSSGVAVINADGTLRWRSANGGCGRGEYFCVPLVADVDLDGYPEIIGGHTLYDRDGKVIWSLDTIGDGFNAVGNFDDDPYAEIVLVRNGQVYLLEHDGQIKWGPVAIPGGGRGGPPTVADFDGDGWPEIGIAGATRYVVFDTDGSQLWESPTVDASSHVTGSTVFDFQNDGSAEVVYRDERHLWVFRGADGVVLFKTPIGSTTWIEAPIVADVDGDGEADIVVSSDSQSQPLPDGSRRPPGLYVFGSRSGDWVAARKIWNQHSYHVTNILPDGTIPAVEQPNWLTPGLNNYRQNVFLPSEVEQADRFTYVASDGSAESAPATVFIELLPRNSAPVLHSNPVLIAATGVPYFYTVRATDPDPGDTLSFALTEAPAGMNIDPATGLIRFVPGQDQLGPHAVGIRVQDGHGFIAQQHYVLEVVSAVQVPDVIGQLQADAEAALEAEGFTPGRVSQARHPSIPPGAVASQSPPGGSRAVPGVDVNIVVSTGTGPEDDDTDGDGYTPNQGDCNDNDSSVHPGASDPEGDGIDQDCDGLDGSEPVVSLSVEPHGHTLLVGETRQLSAFVHFANGSAQILTGAADWSSSNPAVTVSADGRINASAAGNAQVTASFQSVSGSAQITVIARDTTDTVAPLAEIVSPVDGAEVFGPMDIVGSASDPNLVRYELALSPVGETTFTPVATGTSAVNNGVLGTLDPTVLLNGYYRLRLTVVDAGGNQSVDEVMVQLDGERKVGLFTVAFTDLRVPVGGLPLAVERVYDSRDPRQGDFGIGWHLNLRGIRLQCSTTLGEDWYVARSGLSFQLLPTREHACALNLANGRAEVFDFVPSVSVSPLVPFSALNGRLVARAGTLGSLQILDNTHFLIADAQPGPVSLIDDMTLATFNPRRLRYTAPEGTVFEFRDGSVERIIDRNGTSLSFSASGITHSSGIGIAIERDGQGRITRITDPSGSSQHYTYSAAGDLVTHSNALGDATRYTYNSRHGLLSIIDPLGNRAIRTDYDERGRVIANEDAAGNRTTYAHDDNARTLTTTHPDGSITVVSYDEQGKVTQRRSQVTQGGTPVFAEETYAYDDEGNQTLIVDADGVRQENSYSNGQPVRQVIDPGGLNIVTENAYDANGDLTQSIDPLGGVRTYSYDARGNPASTQGPGGLDLVLGYDPASILPATVDNGQGERTQLHYDAHGRVQAREVRNLAGLVLRRSEFAYDLNGRLMSQTEVPLNDEAAARVTRYAYDAAGNLLSVTDPTGAVRSYEYDANGRMVAQVEPDGARTESDYDARGLLVARRWPDGGEETYVHDYAGRLLSQVDAAGVETTQEYDARGRLIAQRRNGQLIQRLEWSAAGRERARIDADGGRTDYAYDAAGRLVSITLPQVTDAVSGAPARPHIQQEYDALGRRTAVTDALGRRTEFDYDAAGFPSRTRHADGSVTEQRFDLAGNLVASIDENGQTTTFEYDAARRLISVLQPAPQAGAEQPRTRYHYDSLGSLRSRVDALGQVTAFEYDAAGRLLRQVRPDGSAREQQWDSAGRLQRVIDYDGTELTFGYDARGRLLWRSGGGEIERIAYDGAGRRTEVQDARGTTRFEYDGDGRLAAIVEADGTALRYGYDAGGRVTRLEAAGAVSTYRYNALGQLVQATTPAGTADYGYDLGGNLVRQQLPNGVVGQVIYDDRNRPLDLAWTGSDGMLERFVSTYSPRGQRLSLTQLDGSREDYDYDNLGRLQTAQRIGASPFALSWQYDAVGNRTHQLRDGTQTLYQYGPNHELLSSSEGSYQYDGRGNRIAGVVDGQVVSYQWDAFGRLVGANTAAGNVQFGYDVDGRRVTRTLNGATTRLLVDPLSVSGLDQVVAERDAGGQVQAAWFHGLQPLTQRRGGVDHHYGYDPHGSVRLLTDTNGTVTDTYGYLPHGQALYQTGGSVNPYRHAGQRWEETALAYDLRARSYDSCSGTFLSPDPFPGFERNPFSLHGYQFADADPVNLGDPLGLFSLPELSFTQNMQTGLRGFDISSRTSTLCKAKAAVDTVNTIIAATQFTAFALNLYFGSADFKVALSFPLKRDDPKVNFNLEINPDLYEQGGFGFNSFEIKGEIEDAGKRVSTKQVLGVKVTPNSIVATGGGAADIDLLSLSLCGLDYAKLQLKNELSAEVGGVGGRLAGSMSFKSALALEFEAAGGLFDAGGLKWEFVNISRSSH